MSTSPLSSSSASPGSHVLVTGAGTGIGRAITVRLARQGHRLTVLGRTEARLRETMAEATEAGAPAVHVAVADVADRSAVDRVVNEAAAALGPYLGVVTAAGIGGPNHPGADDRFDQIVATNLTGTYNTLRAVERHLAEGPSARHMVAISSILGRFGVPGYTGYCASKTAVLGLVRAMALELAGQNVQVNAICPGWVETDMAWQGIGAMARGMGIEREAAYKMAMSAVPLGRMSQPEHVAGVVAWLMSADATGVTGQGIDINNGAWMG